MAQAIADRVQQAFDHLITQGERPNLARIRTITGDSVHEIRPHLLRCFEAFMENIKDDTFQFPTDTIGFQPIDVRWLPIKKLEVDARYQRPLRQSTIEKLSRGFDEQACGVIIVSEREDGSLWILDGNHRTSVKRNQGHELIKAEVLHDLPYWREAQIFVRCNVERGTVMKRDVFRANVIAKDETAVTIQQVLEQHDLAVDPKQRTKHTVAAVSALEMIVKLYGELGLQETMRQVVAAWPDNADAFHGMLLRGLAKFLSVYDEQVKHPRLTRILRQLPPAQLLTLARQFRETAGGSIYTSVGRVIVERYNRGSMLENRLNPADL